MQPEEPSYEKEKRELWASIAFFSWYICMCWDKKLGDLGVKRKIKT